MNVPECLGRYALVEVWSAEFLLRAPPRCRWIRVGVSFFSCGEVAHAVLHIRAPTMAAPMASMWPLKPEVIAVLTNPEILIGTFGYLLLKPLLKGSSLVDGRKGAYKYPMIAYNALMAVFSAACFIMTTVALGWDMGYGKSLLEWAGDTPSTLYTNSCPSPVYKSYLFTMAAKAFYYSKYVEYLDTVWLILKDKPVSFLQTFHHFGAPWDVYLGCVRRCPARRCPARGSPSTAVPPR